MNEFAKFRRLLDMNGIPWHDASGTLVHRTHGEGFSCIYGFGTYGYPDGLLELALGKGDGCSDSMMEPVGHLTADEAFKMVSEHDDAKIVKIY